MAATIQCSRCGAVSEKIGAKDRLRRFQDKAVPQEDEGSHCELE